MLEPWNDASVLPPPVCTLAWTNQSDVESIAETCETIIKVLKQQSPLHKEAATLSRIVYKFDKKFRNDIGFRNLKKVKTALNRYLKVNFLKDIENFEAALPSNSEIDLFLPSRQMLEYVLVRLLTFSKLMMRICVCCRQAGIFYFNRMRKGDSYWMSLVPYAVLCRLWSISKVMLQHCCRWYLQLHKFLPKLKSKGLNFLPQNYVLPTNLSDWLQMDKLEEFGRFEWTQNRTVEYDPDLLEDEDGTFDNILEYVNNINEDDEDLNIPKALEIGNLMPQNLIKPERGEFVSRETFMNMISTDLNKVCKDISTHSAENITTKHALVEFLNHEECYRNESSVKSVTTHLSFMQWQALKNILQKLIDSLASNRKIERKFQKIWKEKCLDYLE